MAEGASSAKGRLGRGDPRRRASEGLLDSPCDGIRAGKDLYAVASLASGQCRRPLPETADDREHWLIRTEATKPTLLLVSQTWYPGWTALVNGQPSEILRANVAFQAIKVPAGSNTVELRYREPGLAAGRLHHPAKAAESRRLLRQQPE